MKTTHRWKLAMCTIAATTLTLGSAAVMAETDGKPDKGDRPHKRMLEGPRAEGKDQHRPERRGFDGEHRRGRDQGKRIMQHLLHDLDLTSEQHEQIKIAMEATRDTHMKWREAHADQAKALRADVRKAVEAKDRQALKELREKMKALRADAPKPEDALAKIRPILTEDQAKTFDTRVSELKERMQAHRKQMREGRPGVHGEGKDGDRPARPEGRNRNGDRPAGSDADDKLDI